MNFYKDIFGGTLQISRFGDFSSPEMPVADEYKNQVMHATLTGDAITFMASDGMPGRPVTFGDSVNMSLAGQDEAQLTGYFNGLSEGGTVTTPLDKQVWGDTFGMVTDKFGIHWLVNISAQKSE